MLFCGSVWPPPSIAAMHGGSRSGPCPSRRRARPRLAWAFIAADLPRLSQAAALRCGAGSLPIYDCALQLSLPCAVCRGALKPLCAAALQLLFAALLAAAVCAALFAACCLGRRSAPLLMAALRRRPRPLSMRRAAPAGAFCLSFCLSRTGKWTFLFI